LSKGEEHDEIVPINLHLDCDNYSGDLLLKDKHDPEMFTSIRVVPPGDRKFFFSIAGKQYTAEDQAKFKIGKLDVIQMNDEIN